MHNAFAKDLLVAISIPMLVSPIKVNGVFPVNINLCLNHIAKLSNSQILKFRI